MSGSARRTAVTLLAGLVAAGAMTVASAYLRTTGTGTGGAVTGTARPVDLAPGSVGAALYPGGVAPVAVVATNPNPGPVRLTRLSLDPSRGANGFAVDTGHTACTTTALALAPSDNGGSGWTVPGGGTLTITIDGAVSAGTSLPGACQGATVIVYLGAS